MVRVIGERAEVALISKAGQKRFWSQFMIAVLVLLLLLLSFVQADGDFAELSAVQQEAEESLLVRMLRQRQRSGDVETTKRSLQVDFNYVLVSKIPSLNACPMLVFGNPGVTLLPVQLNETCLANITIPGIFVDPPVNITSILVDCVNSGQLLLFNDSTDCGATNMMGLMGMDQMTLMDDISPTNGDGAQNTLNPPGNYISTVIACFQVPVDNGTLYWSMGCMPPK